MCQNHYIKLLKGLECKEHKSINHLINKKNQNNSKML